MKTKDLDNLTFTINKTYLLFFAIFIIWSAFPYIISSETFKTIMPTKVWDDRGVFGDSFGALNTLFSGIALAGLFINIKIQNHQIRKLEEKDDRFEALQEKQILILKNTGLLNYHTNQIMQIERNADQLAEVKGEDYILALIQNHVAQQEQAIAILKESIK